MTRGAVVLARHSFARIRGILLGLGLLLAGFQFLLVQVAAYFARENAFNQLSVLLPDFVRSMAGPSVLAFMSFGGIVSLGYFHPIIITTLTGLMISIATEPAGEVETRFVDLTLARPMTRHDAMARSVIVLTGAGGLMLLLMLTGTGVGLTCCTPPGADAPSPRLFLSLAASLAAVMAAWGGLTLAIASAAKRRAAAGTVAGVCALAAYLLDYLGRAWEPAQAVSRISPFRYFETMPLVMGEPLNLTNISILVGVGALGALIGFIRFARRDI
jgi:putative exporter of polyketide antibiotics